MGRIKPAGGQQRVDQHRPILGIGRVRPVRADVGHPQNVLLVGYSRYSGSENKSRGRVEWRRVYWRAPPLPDWILPRQNLTWSCRLQTQQPELSESRARQLQGSSRYA